jgi:hypothetical protein
LDVKSQLHVSTTKGHHHKAYKKETNKAIHNCILQFEV